MRYYSLAAFIPSFFLVQDQKVSVSRRLFRKFRSNFERIFAVFDNADSEFTVRDWVLNYHVGRLGLKKDGATTIAAKHISDTFISYFFEEFLLRLL